MGWLKKIAEFFQGKRKANWEVRVSLSLEGNPTFPLGQALETVREELELAGGEVEVFRVTTDKGSWSDALSAWEEITRVGEVAWAKVVVSARCFHLPPLEKLFGIPEVIEIVWNARSSSRGNLRLLLRKRPPTL